MATASEAEKLKVFISYSQRDAAAADALVDVLTVRGFEVAIDRRDLPFGEKWQFELSEFIRLSDTVIWLVSEASIQSRWVNWELDEVSRRNKRLVPLMVAETAHDALPRQIGEIHILPAVGIFDLVRDLDTLVQVLETDRVWLKQASRLQDRATEWLSKARTPALLLSRGALTDAEHWKDRRPAKAPASAQEVLELLLASRQSATRRLRWWIGGSLAVAASSIGLAAVAYLQSVEAHQQRSEAENQRLLAVSQRNAALTSESRLLSDVAQRLGDSGAVKDAALLAFEALPQGSEAAPDRPLVKAALDVFINMAHWALADVVNKHFNKDEVVNAVSASDATLLVQTKRAVYFIDWRRNERIQEIVRTDDASKPSPDMLMNILEPAAIAASARAKVQVVAYANGELNVLRERAGQFEVQSQAKAFRRVSNISTLALSDSGQRLAVGTKSGVLYVFELPSGNQVYTTKLHTAAIWELGFRPGSESEIVSASEDGGARTIELLRQRVRATLGNDIARGELFSSTYHPTDNVAASADWSGGVTLWNAENGRPGRRIVPCSSSDETQAVGAISVRFDSTGQFLAIALLDNTVRIWDWKLPAELAVLDGHRGQISKLSISPDGSRIISSSGDGSVRIWPITNSTALYRASQRFGFTYGVDKDVLSKIETIACSEQRQAGAGIAKASPGSVSANAVERIIRLFREGISTCLATSKREELSLSREPPTWCVTGPGLEIERDPERWLPKSPYQTDAWRNWQIARHRRENLPLPDQKQ